MPTESPQVNAINNSQDEPLDTSGPIQTLTNNDNRNKEEILLAQAQKSNSDEPDIQKDDSPQLKAGGSYRNFKPAPIDSPAEKYRMQTDFSACEPIQTLQNAEDFEPLETEKTNILILSNFDIFLLTL